MTDYISREELIKHFCNECDGYCECVECDCMSCKSEHRCEMVQEIDAFPAADVREVKRGKWEYMLDDVYRCTNCGEDFLVRDKGSFVEDLKTYNYCPNCGADMRSTDCTKTATADEEREVLNVRAWLTNGADMREES